MKGKKNRIFFLVILILGAFNFLFSFVPLLSDFSYEFSAANALLFFILTPIYFRTIIKSKAKTEIAFMKIASEIFFLFMLPIIIALATGSACKCSLKNGLLFYFSIPFFTFVYSFLITFHLKNLNGVKFYGAYFSLFLLFLVQPFFEIYFHPQIYFYNPVIGYFPGTIYDKYIPIDSKLIAYRIYILLFLSIPFLIKNKTYVFPRLFILLFVAMFPLKILFGFSTTFDKLEKTAQRKLFNEKFNIYFFYDADTLSRRFTLLEHEYYKTEIENALTDTFSFAINSFIFKNNEQKREFFGAPNADVSKPWQYSVFTTKNSATLKHELVHAYSAKYGKSILRLSGNLNPALIEGLAVAIENNFYGKDVTEIAAAFYAKNISLNPERLFTSYSFFSSSPALSYLFAGAFVKYLLEIYGKDRFVKYYLNDDFEKSYNTQLNKVSNDFFEYLKNYHFPLRDTVLINFVLESKQLFHTFCPHYVAEQEHVARTSSVTNAKKIYKKLYLNYNAPADFFNYLNLEINDKNFDEAYAFLLENKAKFTRSGYKLKFLDYEISLKILNNDTSRIGGLITSLEKTSPFLYYVIKADFYREILVYPDLGKRLVSALFNKNKNEIREFFVNNFSSPALALSLSYFTDSELTKFEKKYSSRFDWYLYFYYARRFLHKLHLKQAETFLQKISNYPKDYLLSINNLSTKISFFDRQNQSILSTAILAFSSPSITDK